MKPVQFCTGFMISTVPANVRVKIEISAVLTCCTLHVKVLVECIRISVAQLLRRAILMHLQGNATSDWIT